VVLKEMFYDSYINLNLDGFMKEGNTVDLTGEELEIYIVTGYDLNG
jgi:hypothetical protein